MFGAGKLSRSSAAEPAVGHRRQPDIDVEPDLVRVVAGDHRPAARLGDIANKEAGPADRRQFRGRRSIAAISAGWPQARLRDGRMTCQVGPSAGKATAPAMQPLA